MQSRLASVDAAPVQLSCVHFHHAAVIPCLPAGWPWVVLQLEAYPGEWRAAAHEPDACALCHTATAPAEQQLGHCATTGEGAAAG
jgi:hypothetical protein